jgi:hypothetical protein
MLACGGRNPRYPVGVVRTSSDNEMSEVITEMVRHTSVVVVFSAIGMFAPALLLAQQADVSKSPAIIEYRPLTLWDKVRIGGAYFTDPSYVGSLKIAYGFSAGEISPDQAVTLIKEGKAVAATINPATGNAVTVNDFSEWKKGSGPVLLSKSDTLLGQAHSTVWLTKGGN